MSFIEALQTKDTFTENGAVTNSTTHNYCLDLFFLAGACRNVSKQNLENLFVRAYNFDRLKTLKIMFWAGDIRQGAGERKFFKTALNWLSQKHPEDIQNNLDLIPEMSRWDVLFDLAIENEVIFSYLIINLTNTQSKNYGLLCKWLPRKATVKNSKGYSRTLYNGLATKIMKRLKISPKTYRKLLVDGTKVVEQKMCKKDWTGIEYSHVPSVAMNKYRKAWYKNDETRFTDYLASVKKGESKINASAIFPHDLIKSYIGWKAKDMPESVEIQWNNLPNFLTDVESNSFIPVCDVSGSMMGVPMEISIALGLYISERNVGAFQNAFLTFSQHPQLQYLDGTLAERLVQLAGADWGGNTNLIATFNLILNKAKEAELPENEMPKTILIISDMEFDEACGNKTNFEVIKEKYAQSGYNMPNIVFWNVNGRINNLPVQVKDNNTALISGASPSIIKAVLTKDLNPVNVMDRVIESERYSAIK